MLSLSLLVHYDTSAIARLAALYLARAIGLSDPPTVGGVLLLI